MWGQVAPRPTGLLLSLHGSVNPLAASRARIRQCLPSRRTLEHDAATRRGAGTDPGRPARPGRHAARFPFAFELRRRRATTRTARQSLSARARAAGVERRQDLVYDTLAAGNIVYVPVSNYVAGDLRAAHEMLVHPRTVPGLSDGGAHSTMVADFDYPTFLLSYWGRDAPRAADARRMGDQAPVRRHRRLVGLGDRGKLVPGRRADINLIDLAALGSTFPTIVDDLPGGGSRLVGRGTGYVSTIVAGEVAFEGGAHTGAMAGGWSAAHSDDHRTVVAARRHGVTARTIVDKIWDEHVVTQLDDGLDVLHVDRHLVHDVTSPGAFTTLSDRSLEVMSPSLTFGSPEHSVTILPGRTEDSNTLSRGSCR